MVNQIPQPAIHLTLECAHHDTHAAQIDELENRIRDQELLIQSLCRQLALTLNMVRTPSETPTRHRTIPVFAGPNFELSEYLAPEIHHILKEHGLSDVTVHDRTRERDLIANGSTAFFWQLAIDRLRTSHITLSQQKELS